MATMCSVSGLSISEEIHRMESALHPPQKIEHSPAHFCLVFGRKLPAGCSLKSLAYSLSAFTFSVQRLDSSHMDNHMEHRSVDAILALPLPSLQSVQQSVQYGRAAFSSSLNQKIKNCKLDKVSAQKLYIKKG